MNARMTPALIRNVLFILLASLLFALPIQANTVPEAQARIKERLAQIDELKEDGSIGENAVGLLSARKTLGPRQQALITAENTDRRIIYDSVAKRTGQSVEAVGAQRALRIAELAGSGVWLQKPSGAWYQKP